MMNNTESVELLVVIVLPVAVYFFSANLIRWLKAKVRAWLGVDELEARTRDLERHFVTKRNAEGQVTETLADVPLKERTERTIKMRGMSMEQRRAWLEKTDGGRVV